MKPSRKQRRTDSQDGVSTSARRRKIRLDQLPDMPLDVLFEVALIFAFARAAYKLFLPRSSRNSIPWICYISLELPNHSEDYL
jgi:hypothetical protein